MKRRKEAIVEGTLYGLQLLVMSGAASSAAIAAVVGQFVLAIVLALVALGVFLRLKRGRLKQDARQES
jgi:heme/copper-type cytochrome/quinol oxidase subunit 4